MRSRYRILLRHAVHNKLQEAGAFGGFGSMPTVVVAQRGVVDKPANGRLRSSG